jgi:hypothetical protein
MKTFSERHGLKPVRTQIQLKSMDESLRNNLWDALCLFYWNDVYEMPGSSWLSYHEDMGTLFRALWHRYFAKPLDTLSGSWSQTYHDMREYFFHCSWNEAYDFVEFVAANYPLKAKSREFRGFCNNVLERNLSAYRFIGEEVADITSEEEIAEIQEALDATSGLEGVNTHLRTALKFLADREEPDYRNSIKESISAVEGLCELISGDKGATLGQALKQIEKQAELHGALKAAFERLYGYTSDADGIRHAFGLLEEPNLRSEDAKFMLVACSAFINYLLAKASRAGIKL